VVESLCNRSETQLDIQDSVSVSVAAVDQKSIIIIAS